MEDNDDRWQYQRELLAQLTEPPSRCNKGHPDVVGNPGWAGEPSPKDNEEPSALGMLAFHLFLLICGAMTGLLITSIMRLVFRH